ncbi:MAG TPA: phosphopantetheine-binding protein [Spirochaetota bacterium]|nr:phosphopantetheine-binding protein [Spirochaetota bacterium]
MLDQGTYQENASDNAVLNKVLTGESPAAENIISLLKGKLREETLYHNQTLHDLGIDSLRLIDLVVFLEHELAVRIDNEVLQEKRNLGELVSCLETLEKTEGASLDERILHGEITTHVHPFFNPFHHICR